MPENWLQRSVKGHLEAAARAAELAARERRAKELALERQQQAIDTQRRRAAEAKARLRDDLDKFGAREILEDVVHAHYGWDDSVLYFDSDEDPNRWRKHQQPEDAVWNGPEDILHGYVAYVLISRPYRGVMHIRYRTTVYDDVGTFDEEVDLGYADVVCTDMLGIGNETEWCPNYQSCGGLYMFHTEAIPLVVANDYWMRSDFFGRRFIDTKEEAEDRIAEIVAERLSSDRTPKANAIGSQQALVRYAAELKDTRKRMKKGLTVFQLTQFYRSGCCKLV